METNCDGCGCPRFTFLSHSSLSAEERRSAEEAFAQAQDCVIVATSTLELGIDVGDLDRVIQIDASNTVASFHSGRDVLELLGTDALKAGQLCKLCMEETGMARSTFYALWSELKGFRYVIKGTENGFWKRGADVKL